MSAVISVTRDSIGAHEIARLLAERIDQLVRDLLPRGHREGRHWRCGSVAGDRGYSLCVELAGSKRGIWLDHANDNDRGDALDLVKTCLGCTMAEALVWSARWLGIAEGEAEIPQRPASAAPTVADRPPTWPKIWRQAKPITGTLAAAYLAGRGLAFADPHGDVLRFDPRRARLQPGTDDKFEHHPALLALLRDVYRGEPCGIHNIYLRPDGTDRLREKGKTTTGRVGGAAVMLSEFEDVSYGLSIAEGVETAIGVLMDDLAPVWALCGAGNLAAFPVLLEIQSLTVAADTGAAGQAAAREVAARWRKAGRETRIVSPAFDDWAAHRKTAP